MPLLRGPLEPAWMMGRAYRRLFDQIPVDPDWERAVRAASARGAVVHVVRNVSVLDLLALDHLTRRLDLPRIGFANELGAWLGPSWLGKTPARRLREAIESGESALLFMKRHPALLPLAPSTHRGRSEGDDLLRILIELQRQTEREIIMVPETLVWTQGPDRLGFSVVDTLFGSADFPGELRAAGQLLLNHKNCVIRAGEPLSLRDLLAQKASGDDAEVARRLTYALLRKVERERRAIVGPARKAPDRVRDEVLRSPKLRHIVSDMVEHGGADAEATARRADKMLKELSALPSPELVEAIAPIADALVQQRQRRDDRIGAGAKQHGDEAAENLQRDVAGKHISEKTNRQADRA